MAGPVTDSHRYMYRNNLQMAVQEKKAQFEPHFMYDGALSGKEVQITDIIGVIEARLDAPEGGNSPDQEGTHEPVWVRPRRIDTGKLMKVEDVIKAATDYKSQYVQAMAAGIQRKKNIIFAEALFGPRLIGKQTPTSTNWNGRTVGIQTGTPASALADTGMNVAKILAAIKNLELDDIDFEAEDCALVLDPVEMEDLYRDVTFTSQDYRSKAVLEDKRVLSILGITILPSKRLADASAGVSTAALFCKSGMMWGEFWPVEMNSAPDPGKQFREQVYIETWIGASRTEDARVVKILNKQ